MSEFKFSKGPWVARESLVTVPGSTICRAHQHDGMRDLEETHANARLIAAAPEMVEMLADIAEYEGDGSAFDGTYRHIVKSMSDKARALLSKIKGEEQ